MKRERVLNGKTYCSYAIYEVYYDENGKPEGWTENPVTQEYESAEELEKAMTLQLKAFEKPILDYK